MGRLKTAEINKLDNGKFVDTETGEVFDKNPEQEKSYEQKVHDLMYDKVKVCADDYRDSKYYNSYGKVSPFNIIFNDNLNDIYSQDPKTATQSIINIIKALNQQYANDKTYDYVSDSYLKKMEYNLAKMKTIDKIVQYLTNIYFKGIGMSGTGSEENNELDKTAENNSACNETIKVLEEQIEYLTNKNETLKNEKEITKELQKEMDNISAIMDILYDTISDIRLINVTKSKLN